MLTEELDSEPKKWQSGDPYQYPIPCDGDPWQKLLKPLLERDRAQCESWKDEVHNLLIFAGLFSSVLTSFVLVSYSSLQPDQNKVIINILAHIAARLDNPLNNTLLSGAEPVVPAMLEDAIPSSSTRINIFWFTSLVLSLTAALIGIISLQWLEEHQHYQSTLSSRQKFALFNMRLEGLKAWHLPEIFSALPLLLQLALTLFFVGLIDFLFHSSSAVAIPVVAFIGIPFTFVILTTVIPALQTFGFCLPLPGKVPQQAPYKSTQSRLFRHLLIYSKHVFRLFAYVYYSLYRYIFLLPSRFRRKRDPRLEVLTTDYDKGYIDILVDHILRSENWLIYDMDWLIMRDAYAESIFDGKHFMHHDNMQRSQNSAPFYDLTRAIRTITRSRTAEPESADLRLCYLCVQDITSSILGGKMVSAGGPSHNQYLQSLLIPSNYRTTLPKAQHLITTFSSLLMDPPIEFMQDENQLIYLSDPWRLSPLMAQHFVELYIRIANYIYSAKGFHNLQKPLTELPHYPDGQINRIYDQGPWAVVDYSSYLGGDISRQFSSVVKGYLEVITSQDLDADALLNSIHGRITASFLHCTVVRQSSEMVASTLDFLSTHIKHSMVGELDKRSDFLFYFSSFYIYTVLFPSQVGFIFSEPPNNEDSDPTVMAFLQVLYQYQDARGIPDVALREQLGIPDISEELWDFFERRQGNRHRFAVNEDVLPERPALNTAPARQELLPRPAKNVRETSTDERRQNDISRVSADALSLV